MSTKSLHRRVLVTEWHAPMSPMARLVRLWLKTGDRTTHLPGVVLVGRAGVAEDMGLDDDVARAALAELEDLGVIVADWRARVVWLPERLTECPPDSSKTVLGWLYQWAAVPACALRSRIERALVEHCAVRGRTFLDAARAIGMDVDAYAPAGLDALAEAPAAEPMPHPEPLPMGLSMPHPMPHPEGHAEPLPMPLPMRDQRSEIRDLPPYPPSPQAVEPDDGGELAAWVAGWGRGASGSALPPTAPPGPATAARDAALAELLELWRGADVSSAWATPRAAEGAARALASDLGGWRSPPTLERLLRMPGRLAELVQAGEAYQPRRTLVAPAGRAPLRAVEPPEAPGDELAALDALAALAPARLTPAQAARRAQLRLQLGAEGAPSPAGELRAPVREAAHRGAGALRRRDPTSEYSRRAPRLHTSGARLALPFTEPRR